MTRLFSAIETLFSKTHLVILLITVTCVAKATNGAFLDGRSSPELREILLNQVTKADEKLAALPPQCNNESGQLDSSYRISSEATLEIISNVTESTSPGNSKSIVANLKAEAAKLKTRYGDICGLTEMDYTLILFYTGLGYIKINQYLRTESPKDELLNKVFLLRDRINETLAKLKPYEGFVRRGTGVHSGVSLYQPGSVVEDPSFVSTSRKNGFSEKVRFVIYSTMCRDISAFSTNPGEAEVLCPTNISFRVYDRATVQDPLKAPPDNEKILILLETIETK